MNFRQAMKLTRCELLQSIFNIYVEKYLASQASKYLEKGNRPLAVYSFDHIGRIIVIEGLYEKRDLNILGDFLNLFCKDKSLALDVGANIGNHACYFQSIFSKVIAFEPNEVILPLLHLNSKSVPNIEVREVALGERNESIDICYSYTNIGSGSIIRNNECNNSKHQIVKVETLDGQGLKNVGFIKIDVEGNELSVLKGGVKLISESMPIIAFEQNAIEIQDGSSKTIDYLRVLGYEFFEIQHQRVRLGPLYLKRILNLIFDLVLNRIYRLQKISYFQNKNYSLIIATPIITKINENP